uniref:Protein broad-minded n=1 Tax=Periophthalmus magnuspinnatus TaxID=409849 RepID=A0A3B4AVZ5_9GOBI
MSQLTPEDELQLQSLLKQLLQSINDRISNAPSTECAEEVLLHLEETDKNFHNYEFVKYLRQYMETSLGTVVEEEIKNLTKGDGQHAVGSGQDTVVHSVTRKTRESAEYQQMMQALKNTMVPVVESLISKFEEDQLRKEEMHREAQHTQSNTQYNDCSDSDSSFNQSYAFIRQEQLQALTENLDSSKPKEVRWEALQALCSAPPSDVLSCESWSSLRRNLCAALTEPDLSDHVLQFFAKSFSSSPLNVTREIYTSLAQTVESSFHSLKVPLHSGGIDINRPEISRLLKQIRLMNDFQKEVTTFWIRHPEKYMEEVIESTFSLLAFHSDNASSPRSVKLLEPLHLLALLDIKATWFKKWMHGHYSRTVVLRLLEKKYKSLVIFLKISFYTETELEYALFVHSLSVLGMLLIYTNGRRLFPVKVHKYKDPVTLTELLVILINIMYQHPKYLCITSIVCLFSDMLSPSGLVMEVLWMLCERTECAADCLHMSPVIETLLAPVLTKLKSPPATLTLIADVLARIANTNKGLDLFLHKKDLMISHSQRTSAAHIIVQFTLKLLNKQIPGLSDPEVSYSLCGAFIFVCRQMYNTCEGLQELRPYGLHKALATSWRQVTTLLEGLQTPAPGTNQGLNSDLTPKGLLLLQQTGAINECVGYMFSRFTKKLQVLNRVKFGYGVMVTQIAATAPGVVALSSSGFIKALVIELWSVLECGNEDVRVVRPKPTPMDPIDRSCLKSFLSLVNLLSSSQSVWELLGHQTLANMDEYTLREVPTSIPDLIDRLIAVNSDAKIHSLFHFEQSHTFGLRVLSALCCNLDTFLLLESQYNICSMLLQRQKENVAEMANGTGEIILDSLSVERNYVLVSVSVVGGPSERKLPPRSIQEGDDPFPWPMFSCYPVPQCYALELKETDPELNAFLASAEDISDESWMEVCRSHYRRIMAKTPTLLTGEGKELSDATIQHFIHFLIVAPPSVCLQDSYPGYDWLSSTVFLVMKGDMDRALRLLLDLSSLLVSAFIWPARIHASVHVPLAVAESGIGPVYWCTAHYVEMLLKSELPLVHSAFRISGFTPSQMCIHWLTQCLWNYLDWPEIVHYLSTCVLMGADYQVYMCVALFKHLQPAILQQTQSQELQVFLKEEPIRGFRVCDYLDFMEDLEHKYRDMVLTDMKNICNPVD